MKGSPETIKVGIAEMKLGLAPDKIRTSGLGSCVGAVIYDPVVKVAGMVHIMLPDSSLAKGREPINHAKFADTALTKLVDALLAQGGKKERLKAKIAGGAQMFQFDTKSEQLRVGPRNVEAVKTVLEQLHIFLAAEDTGGNCGRTIIFDIETSFMEVRTVNKGIAAI